MSPTPATDPTRFTPVTETVLWHGQELILRPIRPADNARHGEFFAHESPDDLRLRFFGGRSEVPPDEITRLVHPDPAKEVALIALAQRTDRPPEEVATARAVSGADNVEAEFGITVRSDLKGQGLGKLLLAKLIDGVRRRGTQRMVCEVLPENKPMRALATRLGFRIEKRKPGRGSLRYVLELQPTQHLSTR